MKNRFLHLVQSTALFLSIRIIRAVSNYLNFMGSQDRQQFHKDLTPDLYILPKRPSFGIKGSDNCEYAWFTYPGEGRWYILDT